jgi:predicted kinase
LLRALEPGNNVVIDYGLWGRDERPLGYDPCLPAGLVS